MQMKLILAHLENFGQEQEFGTNLLGLWSTSPVTANTGHAASLYFWKSGSPLLLVWTPMQLTVDALFVPVSSFCNDIQKL